MRLAFGTGTSAAERMRIDSSGRLLVGTSSALTGTNSANGILTIKGYPGGATSAAIFNLARGLNSASVSSGNTLGRIVFADQQAGEYALIEGECDGTPGSGDYPGRLTFSTTADGASSPTERMRIDSSGRLLVGTSSAPTQGLYAQYAPLTVRGYIGNSAGNGVINISSGTAAASLASGNDIGTLAFSDSNGGEFARISCFVDAACASNDYPGRLVFSTTADGASSPTERVKILNSGAMLVPYIYATTSASAANVIVGSDGNLFRSTSSGKYKTQVEDLQDSYADALLNCRPVWYRSTCELDDATYGYWGFIAEEVAEIDPRLIHWKKTEITYDEEGKTVETACEPEAEGVQYDRFVPHLLNLIKRQQTAIETLEQRLSDAGIA